jgi:hypothetical protein
MHTETGLSIIQEAFKRCKRELPDVPIFYSHVPGSVAVMVEQIHHGTTYFALAAWSQLRSIFRERISRVYGTADYMVPDMDGKRTIAEPALMIVRDDGKTLALTGCSWGYGGEGCQGTAAILHDLGFFPTMDDARRFVGQQTMDKPWQLEKL